MVWWKQQIAVCADHFLQGFKFLYHHPALVPPGTTPSYLLSMTCFWVETLKFFFFSPWPWLHILVCISSVLASCGCSNSFYWERQKADSDMNGEFYSNLMSENSSGLFLFPLWKTSNGESYREDKWWGRLWSSVASREREIQIRVEIERLINNMGSRPHISTLGVIGRFKDNLMPVGGSRNDSVQQNVKWTIMSKPRGLSCAFLYEKAEK